MYKKRLALCIVAFLFSTGVLARDINVAKKNALEKIDNLMKEHKKTISDTLTNLPNKESNIKGISNHIREAAVQILESIMYNIRKTAVTGFMMDDLLGNVKNVKPCIETKEKNGHDQCRRYYTQKFLNPVNEYETEAENVQSQYIRTWIEEYNIMVLQFTEIYSRTTADIQKSEDETEIANLVENFERSQREMGHVVTKINQNLDQLQLQFLQILDNTLNNIRNSLRIRDDRVIQEVRDCFGTLLQEKSWEPSIFSRDVEVDDETIEETIGEKIDEKIDEKINETIYDDIEEEEV